MFVWVCLGWVGRRDIRLTYTLAHKRTYTGVGFGIRFVVFMYYLVCLFASYVLICFISFYSVALTSTSETSTANQR